jgi:hypothetical protein
VRKTVEGTHQSMMLTGLPFRRRRRPKKMIGRIGGETLLAAAGSAMMK